MTDDWNPNDPDATKVLYDLSMWSFDQQAELASELADAEIPHTWEGAELVVPEDSEALADTVITALEARLGITYDEAGEVEDGFGRSAGELPLPEPVPLTVDDATTEYDLAEWPAVDRDALTRALTRQRHPFRWEDEVLLVRTTDEALVESLLDLVEAGDSPELAADYAEYDEDDRLPFETLTTFFLAGERLKRNPLDADGLEQLLLAGEVADPTQPPFGVEMRLWQRTCDLADQLAAALVDEDQPDEETAQAIAGELHDLLRPYI